MYWYILVFGWGKFKAKTGGEEVDVNRGAHNKPKSKREGAEEEKDVGRGVVSSQKVV